MKYQVDFGRLMCALIAPFNADQSLNLDLAGDLAYRAYAQGSTSLLVNGTTGESPTLSSSEKKSLISSIVERMDGACPIIANVGCNSTELSIRAAQEAQELGVQALMAVIPYYNKPPQRGLYAHFSAIAKATELPLILYNIPGRCSVNMTAETTLELASNHQNIVAIKEASGNLDQVEEICKNAPEGFQVFSGDDALTLECMKRGAHGVISTTANVSSPLMRAIVDAAAVGDWDAAQLAHDRALGIMQGLFKVTNPILTKKALQLLGYNAGPLRLPLVEATEEETQALKNVLSTYEEFGM